MLALILPVSWHIVHTCMRCVASTDSVYPAWVNVGTVAARAVTATLRRDSCQQSAPTGTLTSTLPGNTSDREYWPSVENELVSGLY